MKDKSPLQQSKKQALFAVVNMLFTIYYRLNTVQIFSKTIKPIEATDLLSPANIRYFPVNDIVTYKYYIGRLKMLEDKYDEARLVLPLTLAKSYCHLDVYLEPVFDLLGDIVLAT